MPLAISPQTSIKIFWLQMASFPPPPAPSVRLFLSDISLTEIDVLAGSWLKPSPLNITWAQHDLPKKQYSDVNNIKRRASSFCFVPGVALRILFPRRTWGSPVSLWFSQSPSVVGKRDELSQLVKSTFQPTQLPHPSHHILDKWKSYSIQSLFWSLFLHYSSPISCPLVEWFDCGSESNPPLPPNKNNTHTEWWVGRKAILMS